jgi:hypothetical protein
MSRKIDFALEQEIEEKISAILSAKWVPERGKGQKMPPPDEVKEPPSKKPRTTLPNRCQRPWQPLLEVSGKWRQRYDSRGPESLTQICVRECGAGGDCLFYAVAIGYQLWENPNLTTEEIEIQSDTWMLEAREWAASGITAKNVRGILKQYQTEWFADYVWRQKLGQRSPWNIWPSNEDTWKPYIWGGTFSYTFPDNELVPDAWKKQKVTTTFDPPQLAQQFLDINHPKFRMTRAAQKTMPPGLTEEKQKQYSAQMFQASAFREIVKTAGEKFRGDEQALEWMIQGTNPIHDKKVGFIILSDVGRMNCAFYPSHTFQDFYMVLYNLHHSHWQLAGISDTVNGAPRSVFRATEIPDVLETVWVQDCIVKAQDVQEMQPNHPMRRKAKLLYP